MDYHYARPLWRTNSEELNDQGCRLAGSIAWKMAAIHFTIHEKGTTANSR